MIKINLLGVAPPPSRVHSMGGPAATKTTQIVIFVGALIICFGIVGVIYKVWSSEIADLAKARNREKIRESALALVQAQNEKYQQRLTDLETRINTIQALQNNRVGPVELMSAVGTIVNKTNDVYLFTLGPAGDRVQLKGQSGTVDSMANFLAYLKNYGTFDDVQLEQFYQDDQGTRLNYKFVLSCLFKSPSAGTSPTAGGAAAGSGGPGGPGGPRGPSAPGGPQGAPGQAPAQNLRLLR